MTLKQLQTELMDLLQDYVDTMPEGDKDGLGSTVHIRENGQPTIVCYVLASTDGVDISVYNLVGGTNE